MALTAEERKLIQDTHDRVIRLTAVIESCREAIAKHDKVLYGNSHPGLVTRVMVIWWVAVIAAGGVGIVGVVKGILVAVR